MLELYRAAKNLVATGRFELQTFYMQELLPYLLSHKASPISCQ